MLESLLRLVAKRRTPHGVDDDAVVSGCDGDGRPVEVGVRRHPQSRRLRLIVDDGGARVVAPMRASRIGIVRFVVQHHAWIARQLAIHCVAEKTAPIVGVDDRIHLRGIATPLRWMERGVPQVVQGEDGAVVIGVPLTSPRAAGLGARALRAWLIAEATRDIARCNESALLRIDARASRVSVRPLKSLWGSISVDGSMRIDLALLLAPPEILDYVVVHEACHRHERNHGPRFWAHVARAHPNYREHRRWLREHGPGLKSELARFLGMR